MSTEDKKGNVANSPSGVGDMEYNFREIEKKWQERWKQSGAYKVSNDSLKPKCYVLDMFPYPSGAGLHVGHPLGYIASDIYSRYKRLKGFNVLHPMGFDSFGLPAEQYALDSGQHPSVTTKKNIETFKAQLDNIGFCYDWDREIKTSDPHYYKWTQWIFLQLFNSYFCHTEKKALPISLLIKKYETEGALPKSGPPMLGKHFSAEQWNSFSEKEKADILMRRRLAYCGYGEVNWCEALGTVLANDEVINGVSERGGYPVVKKTLRQWYLRITEYADRLLEGLNKVDFSDAMKEMQTNWIGKSSGAEISFSIRVSSHEQPDFQLATHNSQLIVYTTRPDTIFGVDFMVIAPEHELVDQIKTTEQQMAVDEYIAYVKSRSERERMAEKKISGVFTGSYAINPFNGREIPIWISEYVLAGYGTGAIMGVPCGDERDHRFARNFNIAITNIIGDYYNGEDANPTYDAKLENSDFLNGIEMRKAAEIVISELELSGLGKRKVNYKMRDAAFSRQRYWGEPFPIIWKEGIAYPLNESELPLILPEVEKYGPGPDGEGPLANIKEWTDKNLETNTMPGYAGSSWYFLRYMDPHNDKTFCDRTICDYWGQVDLYIGGTEHAVGHLLYSRMWTKFLYDMDLIGHDEPYKKLLNQGMITGKSFFVDACTFTTPQHKESNDLKVYLHSLGSNRSFPKEFTSEGKVWTKDYKRYENGIRLRKAHKYLDAQGRLTKSMYDKYYDEEMDISPFYKEQAKIDWDQEERTENGEPFLSGVIIEKMSKSKFNVENPDDIVTKYGADAFRMYEMFLGPVEMSKPWDTKGIEGVHRFLKKFWRLFADDTKGLLVTDGQPTAEELKVLHKTIKKVEEDTERFSFNTAVSAFMIATNELTDLKCHKRQILLPLLILMQPYAPHITEELYNQLNASKAPSSPGGWGEISILNASFPTFEEKYIKESTKAYPVAINGKTRTELTLSLDVTQQQVEEVILQNDIVKKWLEGKAPKKIIYVRNKMINVVI